jgi:(p)ppGpp synthase/HD superfamily hydrolase
MKKIAVEFGKDVAEGVSALTKNESLVTKQEQRNNNQRQLDASGVSSWKWGRNYDKT